MKKIKILIIICAILLVGVSVVYILLNPNTEAYIELYDIKISNEMDDEMVLPKGLYKLGAVYAGELSTEIICKSYNNLATNVIPKYYMNCKNLNNDEIKEFYEKNDKVIYTELGYENFNQFLNLMQVLKTLTGEELVFESYELEGLSLEEKEDSFSMYLKIKYKNNDEIVLNSYVQKKLNKKCTSILLTTDVDLEQLEKKEQEINNTVNNTIDNTVNNTTNSTANNEVEENTIEIEPWKPLTGRAIE